MRRLIVLALLALSLPVCAQDSGHSEATTNMVHGVDSFKAGHYDEATRDFQSAVDAEPSWNLAHLYLGTALAYQVAPNLDTDENIAIANRALDQFNKPLGSIAMIVRSVASASSNCLMLSSRTTHLSSTTPSPSLPALSSYAPPTMTR